MKILMHKDIPVARLDIINNKIHSIDKIYSAEHLPIGTKTDFPNLYGKMYSAWNEMRAIPSGRQGLENIVKVLRCGISESKLKSLNVSLTDCYWVKDEDSSLVWRDVNFHIKGFSDDFSRLIIWNENTSKINLNIPDLTTDGALAKTWIELDGIPTLIKYGDLGPNSNGSNLLSANEVIASKVSELMDIDHVTYYPIRIANHDKVVCACPSFIKDDTSEFVNALQIMKDQRNTGGINLYNQFNKMGMKAEIDKMILFDHILHNNDRHEKNFGIIRDAASLDVIRFAPLFDSGSCLGWDKLDGYDSIETKPFLRERREQISLINRDLSSVPDLYMVKQIIQATYEKFQIKERCFAIACEDLNENYKILTAIKRTWTMNKNEDLDR